MTTRIAIRRTIVGFGLLAAAFASGCARPILTPEEDRSQYDRYDVQRNQQAPAYVEDAYGRRQPNLRGRLSPKNE